jgi:hypothetical protein
MLPSPLPNMVISILVLFMETPYMVLVPSLSTQTEVLPMQSMAQIPTHPTCHTTRGTDTTKGGQVACKGGNTTNK